MLRSVAGNLALATVYVMLGKLGLLLAFVHVSATAVWPPSGLALAVLLLKGPSLWPGVLLGAYIVNITTTGTALSSAGIAVGNTLEALAGMYLSNRFAGGLDAFSRAAGVFIFAAAVLGSATLAATIGVTSLAATGNAAWSDYGFIWLTWWLGDAAGDLIIGPMLILWWRSWNLPRTAQQWREAVALWLTVVAVGLALFTGLFPVGVKRYPLSFLTIPVLVWAGFRFGARETATAVGILSALAIWGTLHQQGPFLTDTPNESLLLLQAFMGIIAVMSLSLAGGVAETSAAQTALRKINEHLEETVQERTAALQTEVAERKRAEESLEQKTRLLAQAQHVARMGSWQWDMTTDTVAWSDELYRLYGISPEQFQATYAAYLQRVHPDDRAEVRRLVDQAARTAEPFEYDQRIVRGDGVVRVMHARGEVLTGPDGKAVRMVGVNQDITEQRMLEQQFHEVQKMESLGRLAGGIAHDFNNMVMAILGFTELLLIELEPRHRCRRLVEQVSQAGEQTRMLTQQLLAISRRQILKPKVIDLNAVLMKLARLLTKLIGEHIEINTHLLAVPGRVKVDPGQLQQVIINLALNARDAMPNGGRFVLETAEVSIAASAQLPPGRYVQVTASDTGSGMDRYTLAHLFEPFFTTKEKGKGTGLGLSTAYGVITQSGGRIEVASALGRGTTFRIYLPATDEPADVTVSSEASSGETRGTETVLIVEDEETVRSLVSQSLQTHGYKTLSAKDGVEAIRLAHTHPGPIHLLLTDIVMPGMSGFEVAKAIEHIRSPLSVIYMSGYSEMIPEGPALEQMTYLQKPVMPGVLARKVREQLDKVGNY